MSDDNRKIGIPPDTYVDHETVFPLSEELPASAWHITEKMKQLHAKGVTGKGVVVAVNDTAGTLNHPFLPKPIAQKNFTGETDPFDGNGHGTHCAGIVKSVAPEVSFITCKVLSNGGSGSTTGINAGRIWAAEQGADIISESLGDGGGPPISADLAAYEKAYTAGVSICVAALGNAGYNGASTIGRPGSYKDHNHGIAAIGSDWRTIAPFSSGGPEARYAAPGVGIVSCKPGGGWVLMSGTSMATPWQAGLYALIVGWRRALGKTVLRGADQWDQMFKKNNLYIDLGAPGWDPRFGTGLVDINKVLDMMLDTAA